MDFHDWVITFLLGLYLLISQQERPVIVTGGLVLMLVAALGMGLLGAIR